MKSMRTPSKQGMARMAQMTSDAYTDALDDTVAQIICSVCRYINLGKKRANDLLDFCEKQGEEYRQYIDDGILTDKLKEELKCRGIDPSDIYAAKEDIRYQSHTIKKRKENPVGFAEAMRQQQKLQELKKFLSEVG